MNFTKIKTTALRTLSRCGGFCFAKNKEKRINILKYIDAREHIVILFKKEGEKSDSRI